MLDRVPTFLEIDAHGLPFPCKVSLRPNAKKYGYTDAQLNLILNNMHVYVSTRTKNPSNRNHQLVLQPPVKLGFQFAPVMDKDGVRDIFTNKIYIGVYYDLSRRELSKKVGEAEEQAAGKEDNEQGEEGSDEMSHINMVIHASFPKDKEEIKRKKVVMMMKKIQQMEHVGVGGVGVAQPLTLDPGSVGERRI